MATPIKKENMTIAIREYTDGQGNQKKVWKTIGELITWDDGRQSFETWGPTGSTKGSIFEQDSNQSQAAAQQGAYAHTPQGYGHQQAMPNQQYAPPPSPQGYQQK
jgi:hypothetical protein